MRVLRLLIPVLAACGGAAQALSIDGDTQLHAAVGQSLSASIPISLAGDEVSRLYYRLTPASGLADAEERAAAAVHASYDPAGPAILLSTAARVTVPAMRLHLEVGAGSVVVSRDITMLFDIPDLSQSAPLDAPGAAKPAASGAATGEVGTPLSASAPEGSRGIAIGKEEDQKTARAFGDSAARAAATGAPPQPQMVLAPRPKYFNTYQVKQGDTLTSIGTHFAHAGAGGVDAVMLSIYEANYEVFPAGDPQHPALGAQLGIPDAASIGSEPDYRVAEFRDYLRKPVGEWQVPVNLLRKPVEPVVEAPKTTPSWMQPHNLIGIGVLLLFLWGLRKLFAGGRHKRAMAARRAASAGGAPAVAPNLVEAAAAPTPLREKSVELVAPPAPETELAEIARLREVLVQQPARADIRLRLAQRMFEARRAPGFAEVALPLEQVLSPEAWERVRAMGHELLPSDFRFAPQSALAPAPELVSLMEKRNQAAVPAAEASSIDFDFHGEMARVDKARSDVFGKGGGQAA